MNMKYPALQCVRPIPLSDDCPKHLILTGQNGSGETSVLEALSDHLNYVMTVNDFDEDTFSFFIKEDGRETFDFYTLSSGFASVLDIILDLMLRMEAHVNKTFDFTM